MGAGRRVFADADAGARRRDRRERNGDEDVQPRRFVGRLGRVDRRQLRATERCEAYLRQRLAKAVESGVTADGWRDDPHVDEAPAATAETRSPARRGRRWWPFGARDQVGDETPSGPVQSACAPSEEAGPAAAPEAGEEGSPDGPYDPLADGAREPGREAPVVNIDDTMERVKDLAPDPDEDDWERLLPDALVGAIRG